MNSTAKNPRVYIGSNSITADDLRQRIEKIERLEEDKRNIAEDISDSYKEAKALGFDAKAMKAIIKIRQADPQKLAEQEAIEDLYRLALGIPRGMEDPRQASLLEDGTEDDGGNNRKFTADDVEF